MLKRILGPSRPVRFFLCTLHPALCTVLLVGCPAAAADHAKLGDQAVMKGDFTTAVGEYRAGVQTSPKPDLLAKLANAAFHLKNYREAADAYRRLGEIDPSRAGEAATGLERVARGAQDAFDALALREALLGLKAIAPERPTGRIALSLALSGKMEPGEALPLIPYALAGAANDQQVDSLLLLYGNANRETTACEEAVRIYRTVLRRYRDGPPSPSASDGLASCAVQLGRDAGALEQPQIAERWFRMAVDANPPGDLMREALLGLGDARLGQGDSLEAAAAYRRALDQAGATDSLGQTADQKLRQLQSVAVPADTSLN
jgi:tetratricopeptide (TPR) repeat protein